MLQNSGDPQRLISNGWSSYILGMNLLLDALVAPINVNAAKPTEKRIVCFHQIHFFFNGWGSMSSYLYELRQEPMIIYKYIWVEKEKKNKP